MVPPIQVVDSHLAPPLGKDTLQIAAMANVSIARVKLSLASNVN